VAKDLTRKRLLKELLRQERKRRRQQRSRPRGPGRRRGFSEVPPDLWEDGPGGDLDRGAGVREPRRPQPTMPADALQLDLPEPQYLDLTR